LEVTMSKITKIDGNIIETADGERTAVDGICYATGFKVTEFLTPIEVVGRNGQTLNEKWKESGGATAYKGVFTSGFPNFAILFGPNTFLAHNSAIFMLEVQTDYTIDRLIKPLIDHRAASIVVKPESEDHWAAETQQKLQKMVWSSGCSNWNLASSGRNTASYPGTGRELYFEYLRPDSRSFVSKGGSSLWPAHAIVRWLRSRSLKTYTLSLTVLALIFSQYGKGYSPFERLIDLKALVFSHIQQVSR